MNRHLGQVDFQRDFKIRLKQLREKKIHPDGKRWTQQDMADALGIEKERYAKWEQVKADKNFPLFLFPRLCEILERDPWDVLTGESPSQSPARRAKMRVNNKGR